MNSQEIKELILIAIPDAKVFVNSEDDTHFEALIVSDQFLDKSMVQQHQLVYMALGNKVGNEIHALSMQTYTSEEWELKQQNIGKT